MLILAFDLEVTTTNTGNKIEFTLQYQTESYRETINNLAFDMATLWSQIGGFIGMFLGFSLLQVPQLSGNVLRAIKTLGSTQETLTFLQDAIRPPCGYEKFDYTICCVQR